MTVKRSVDEFQKKIAGFWGVAPFVDTAGGQKP